MSSAALGNEMKRKLTESSLFKPAIESMAQDRREYKRRVGGSTPKSMRGKIQIKIGHGGTLDPGAEGVVSFGVGNGTKALGFLQNGAEKGYEAVMLFGAATDSFDSYGKVVGKKAWADVTKEKLEASLKQFRGKVMQRPSVYSALKRGGLKMYEYARLGKDIPELEKREMFVKQLEVVEWMDGGSHDYQWPETEIENDRKDAFVKVLRFDEIGDVEVVKGSDVEALKEDVKEEGKSRKRKRQERANGNARGEPEAKQSKTGEHPALPEQAESTAEQVEGEEVKSGKPQFEPRETQTSSSNRPRCPAPAARIRMVVSSGFYVRSLCHDLGVAVGSLALMSTLTRTKQACFELGTNVIPYEEFEKDEEVWGPQVAKELNAWDDRFAELQKERGANGEAEQSES
ncbi:pseudouridine synthase [Myriangium duriaei CBS 260.36]|uniref:tRNA pseudouridine(55) synthase n=1 Tax=Myriangium duriaei CBS 260.36 TaxID=1168546 RepID=A0A9P4JCU4_9PEZI|nr:pseudouridine synthase [Myriangium duriaei CBS 260.36]